MSDKKSQVEANPTKSTLDAVEHEADLERQRQLRKDSTIEIDNPANEARKAGTDDGDKEEQDVSDDYMFHEAHAQFSKFERKKTKGVDVVAEVNEPHGE